MDPDILAVVKTAAVVERNSADYADYLCNVFPEDTGFHAAARAWGGEEIQHGEALGRWAERADPDFDFEAAFERFSSGYRIAVDSTRSVRGSLSGELVARCIVETGTSALYSALRDATDEPVLKFICHKIAGDEFRHYKLFHTELQKYLAIEKPSAARRAWVALGRIREAEDDELGYAYHSTNSPGERYDRKRAVAAYIARTCALHRPDHLRRATAMVLKAVGLRSRGRVADMVGFVVSRHFQRQARKVSRLGRSQPVRSLA